jgi:hypothetical protein
MLASATDFGRAWHYDSFDSRDDFLDRWHPLLCANDAFRWAAVVIGIAGKIVEVSLGHCGANAQAGVKVHA